MSMADICNFEERLKELEEQEQSLQFAEFSNEAALNIGMLLIEQAKKENKVIVIDIARCNGQQLFHYELDGTCEDNGHWPPRKANVVKRFGHSSLYIGTRLKRDGETLHGNLFLDPGEYSAYGGSFPIIIKNAGIIGTITVAGLPDTEDHNLVVTCIKEYLDKNLT